MSRALEIGRPGGRRARIGQLARGLAGAAVWAGGLAGVAVGAGAPRPARAAQRTGDAAAAPAVEEVARGLEHPWALAFLPDGRRLVTERPGRIQQFSETGQPMGEVQGLPSIALGGQGGLLDLVASPGFERDRLVYFAFAQTADGGSRTVVARARLDADGLANLETIFTQRPTMASNLHFGSRLVFARDGNLFVTLGERYTGAQQAQELGSHLGKIIRIRPDGSVPRDNPFVRRAGALGEIWSLGHRNVQGAALHPATGQLWTHEHGAQGGDELNRIDAGRNYGWPVITHGVDYSGAKIGIGTHKSGMQQPLHYWVPSIAPCGMAFCTSERYPGWRGSLLIGSLKFRCLVRLSLDGQRVVGEERLYESLGERIRDVRQGPDGFLYLLTDSAQGRLLRLTPS